MGKHGWRLVSCAVEGRWPGSTIGGHVAEKLQPGWAQKGIGVIFAPMPFGQIRRANAAPATANQSTTACAGRRVRRRDIHP